VSLHPCIHTSSYQPSQAGPGRQRGSSYARAPPRPAGAGRSAAPRSAGLPRRPRQAAPRLVPGCSLTQAAAGAPQVCFNPTAVVQRLQLFRFLTASVFHIGVLHVAFNMLAFVPIGASLERQLGSLQFAYLLLLFTVVGNAIFAAVAAVCSLLCAAPAP
jgi:hypothetical protein